MNTRITEILGRMLLRKLRPHVSSTVYMILSVILTLLVLGKTPEDILCGNTNMGGTRSPWAWCQLSDDTRILYPNSTEELPHEIGEKPAIKEPKVL